MLYQYFNAGSNRGLTTMTVPQPELVEGPGWSADVSAGSIVLYLDEDFDYADDDDPLESAVKYLLNWHQRRGWDLCPQADGTYLLVRNIC